MADALLALLRDGVSVLRRADVRFALIGGCARNVYAPPRATRDVDFSVAATGEEFERVETELKGLGPWVGTTVRADDTDDVPDLILCRDEAGRRLDFLFAKIAVEEAVLAGARVHILADGLAAPVASPEGLAALKLLAGRTRDLADVEEIAATRDLDWDEVTRLCDAWEIDARIRRVRSASES